MARKKILDENPVAFSPLEASQNQFFSKSERGFSSMDTFEQLMASLAHFVPLFQTLVWVLLILLLVFWFRSAIRSLLATIRKRVEQGSELKVAGFELGVLPQDVEMQMAKLAEELEEIEAPDEQRIENREIPYNLGDRKREYLQTEDLAMRALALEYDVPIARNLVIVSENGSSFETDGSFIDVDGIRHVVEVRISLEPLTPGRIFNMASKMLRRIRFTTGTREAHLDFVVVSPAAPTHLDEIEGVTFWHYTREDLGQRFGV